MPSVERIKKMLVDDGWNVIDEVDWRTSSIGD